jgi:hypothetical protein
MDNWDGQDSPLLFIFVVFTVSLIWIIGGAYQAFSPKQMMDVNKKYVPEKSWDLLVRLRIASQESFQVAGYVAVVLGIAGLLFAIGLVVRLITG